MMKEDYCGIEDEGAGVDSGAGDYDEAISLLFGKMRPHRAALLALLTFCREPQKASVASAHVSAVQGSHAVFSPSTLCRMLEEAGAVERLCPVRADVLDDAGVPVVAGEGATEELIPLAWVAAREAIAGEEAGEAYVQSAGCRESYWRTTEAGRNFLGAQDVVASVAQLAERESNWWPVYLELLAYLGAGDGHSQAEIAQHMTALPVFAVESHRLSTAHMIDQLQQAGAIEWLNGWVLTEGARVLLGDGASCGGDASPRSRR